MLREAERVAFRGRADPVLNVIGTFVSVGFAPIDIGHRSVRRLQRHNKEMQGEKTPVPYGEGVPHNR